MARHRDRLQHRHRAGRAALRRAPRHLPAAEAGNPDHAQQLVADRVADPQMGQLPAGQRRRRRRRALERSDLAFPAGRFSHPQPHDGALRRAASSPKTIRSRIGRSATTIWSPITTSSNTSRASPARPAISRAQIQPGGNPFEGARDTGLSDAADASRAMPRSCSPRPRPASGLHPFPRPSANISAAYTNPYGCSMAPCTYCGFCERFGCANYSKASPQTCVLPALVREPTFEARTECEVTKVNLSGDGKTATGVTYVDLDGEEWEQPADLVLVCAYALFNVRLLLLSGIGKPYDPASGRGRGRAQLRLPDRFRLDGIFRGRQIQSVRGRRFARRRGGRLQQRQFRSRAARLCRRRVDHQRPHQRPADPVSPDAARHADLGQPVEEGGAATPISASPMSARRAA